MKHKPKIIAVLLIMFLVTQFIGLYVVHHYSNEKNELPYGMEPPKIEQEKDFYNLFPSIVVAFIIAIALFFLLTHFKIEFILKLWFFVVVIIAIGISLISFFPKINYLSLLVLILAVPAALIKVFNRNILVHNATELLIYPGIAAVFTPLLNIWTVIILLILISLYDMWAVWKSGIMQKMAKFQMDKMKVFGGFFVPYLSKKQKQLLKKRRKKKSKPKRMKVNVAILGGGDVVFPIITAGVMLKYSLEKFGLENISFWKVLGSKAILPPVFVLIGAILGLGYLFFISKKKKFYPAMPFITAGIFLGMLASVLIF